MVLVDSAWGGVVRIFSDCHGYNCELPSVPSPSCSDQRTACLDWRLMTQPV